MLHTSFSFYFVIRYLSFIGLVLRSAEQRRTLQPDGEISVTQSTSSNQQSQKNVSSCGHKMVLLFQIPFSLSSWCQVLFYTTLKSKIAQNSIDLFYTFDRIMSDHFSKYWNLCFYCADKSLNTFFV